MIELKRSKCSILSLVLKGKWFDMIASGEKREEYRLPTRYWRKRLHNWDRKFTENTTPDASCRVPPWLRERCSAHGFLVHGN